MNGTRHHLLARATLAQDEHGMHAVGSFGNNAIQPLHFWRAADHASVSLFGLHLLAEHAIL